MSTHPSLLKKHQLSSWSRGMTDDQVPVGVQGLRWVWRDHTSGGYPTSVYRQTETSWSLLLERSRTIVSVLRVYVHTRVCVCVYVLTSLRQRNGNGLSHWLSACTVGLWKRYEIPYFRSIPRTGVCSPPLICPSLSPGEIPDRWCLPQTQGESYDVFCK